MGPVAPGAVLHDVQAQGPPVGVAADPVARFAARLGDTGASAGVHPKVVQERLGHANISITLDTYSHVTASLHTEAAEQVAAMIFGSGETVG